MRSEVARTTAVPLGPGAGQPPRRARDVGRGVRYKHPRSQVHANGIYGGVGTRPSPGYWIPGGPEETAEEERIPPALRRVRLRRTRPRRMHSYQDYRTPEFFVLILCSVFAVVVFLILLGVLHIRIK